MKAARREMKQLLPRGAYSRIKDQYHFIKSNVAKYELTGSVHDNYPQTQAYARADPAR
jgi:hypothetical protein